MFLGSDELSRRTIITAQAKSDGLQLLRAINATQAHGQEGARVDPTRAAHEAGLNVGDVGSERYHHALGYLLEEAALLGTNIRQPRRAPSNTTATRSTSSLGGL
jgi:hypothetical protein